MRKGHTVPAMVTFVVIAFNEELGIADCLRSILAQQTDAAFDVLVVDDGSEDKTADVVRGFEFRSRVQLIELGRNCGRGAARLAGVQAATSSFIAMMDSDIALPTNWLQTCLDELAMDPDCMAVGGVAVPDGDVTWLHKYTGLSPLVVPHALAVTGSNGLYRREIFDLVSYAPHLRQGEDVAFNYELIKLGIRTRSLPQLTVDHIERKSYVESLRWLYGCGLDASRQLERFHRVRAVDCAAALFLGSVLTALPAGRGRTWRRVGPPSALLALSVFHLNRKFELLERGPSVAAKGTVAFSTLLLAYFCGRFVGHSRSVLTRGTADVFQQHQRESVSHSATMSSQQPSSLSSPDTAECSGRSTEPRLP